MSDATRTIELMQKDIELYLSTISADQTAFGTILQVMLLNLMRSSKGAELFHAMRVQVLATIDNTQPSKDDPQGAERHKQLTRIRAEEFFQVIGKALGVEPDKPAPSTVS